MYYIDSPYPIARINGNSPFKNCIRRWKKGVKEYKSVVFAKKDQNINSIDDLVGKTIAFEEEFSTGSYALPIASLKNLGYQFIRTENSTGITAKTIKYAFSEDDENTAVWVLKGKVAAGTFSSTNFDKMNLGEKSKLKIVYSTIAVPRHMVCSTKAVSSADNKMMMSVLQNMHKDAKGQDVLQKFGKTSKFDQFEDEKALMVTITDLFKNI